jgi:maltose O-acetyltransferase
MHVWLGAGCIVMADVGENSIVGAGSVVTKPIPPNSVAVGNPARVLRKTFDSPTPPPVLG